MKAKETIQGLHTTCCRGNAIQSSKDKSRSAKISQKTNEERNTALITCQDTSICQRLRRYESSRNLHPPLSYSPYSLVLSRKGQDFGKQAGVEKVKTPEWKEKRFNQTLSLISVPRQNYGSSVTSCTQYLRMTRNWHQFYLEKYRPMRQVWRGQGTELTL